MFNFLLFYGVSISRKICIDAGFGQNDSSMGINAQGPLNLAISYQIAKKIRKLSNYSSFLIRRQLKKMSVNDRFKFANYLGCDIVLTMKLNTNEDDPSAGMEAYVSPLYDNNELILRNLTLKYALSLGQIEDRPSEITKDEGTQRFSVGTSAVFFLLFVLNIRERIFFDEYYKDYADLIAKACIDTMERIT